MIITKYWFFEKCAPLLGRDFQQHVPLYLVRRNLFYKRPISYFTTKRRDFSLRWKRRLGKMALVLYYPLPVRQRRPLLLLWILFYTPTLNEAFNGSLIAVGAKKFATFCWHQLFFIRDEGLLFLRGFVIIFGADALLSDDEPLWEPIEWSLVQTWLFFIFLFAWIGENLISSRFGSYVGRDKRVWFAWYKSFWLIEIWYLISYGLASLFVIVPFYYEISYSIAFITSWWDWYSRVFIFKFVSLISLLLVTNSWISLNLRWIGARKLMLLFLGITVTLSYLFFCQVYLTLFAYFTDPLWYQKTRVNDFVQLSHEPNKWGWGGAKRDHFTYHRVSTVFWFKSDGPFASAFLMINLYFILALFFNLLFWLVLLRKTFYLNEVHYTLWTYTNSSLRQLLYAFLLIYALVFMSFLAAYWRFPPELFWVVNSPSWLNHFLEVLLYYLV